MSTFFLFFLNVIRTGKMTGKPFYSSCLRINVTGTTPRKASTAVPQSAIVVDVTQPKSRGDDAGQRMKSASGCNPKTEIKRERARRVRRKKSGSLEINPRPTAGGEARPATPGAGVIPNFGFRGKILPQKKSVGMVQ